MSENKKLIPKRRFNEFKNADAWEQRELGETLDDLKSGLSRKLSTDDIGLPVVRANNINDAVLNMMDDVKYWFKDDPQGATTSNYFIRKGDILINFINSETKMGTGAIVDDEPHRETIYTTNILRARLKPEYDIQFWFALTQTKKYKYDIKLITKPAVNQASFTTIDYKNLKYKFPEYNEQHKIGNFFSNLDQTIAFQQRKLEKMKSMKSAYLSEMFPAEGERKPKRRFPGFTDAWEQRELGGEVEFFSGLTYSPSNVVLENGTLVLRSSNVKNGEIVKDDNVFVDDRAVNSENVKSGDIVVVVRNGSRNLIGKHAQIKEDMENWTNVKYLDTK